MSAEETVIRPAGPDDVPAIAALEAASFPEGPWSEGLVAEGVAGLLPTVTYLVAERSGAFAGHAVVSVVQDVAELQRVATTAAHRRTGVASALLSAVDRIAAQGGAERLLLEVREDNVAALAFYARAGFAEIARRARYYRDGTTAVVLERPVTPYPGARE